MIPTSIEEVAAALEAQRYIADRPLATALFLSLRLQRPLFLEGEPGVGKTEIAKALSNLLEVPLIRLQCYEGLDLASAVYEWDYTRQILQLRLLEAAGVREEGTLHQAIYGPEFLLERPLLQALRQPGSVLLIDEVDRADQEFEAFLLELLSDWQITIPELGTLRAEQPPRVILTSNRTREVHDALKRRCLYHWIDYPSFAKEYRIVQEKVPGLDERLSRQLVTFVQELRRQDLYKPPGIAETLDWAASLLALGASELSPEVVEETLGALLKYQEDLQRARELSRELLGRTQER
jgi:MoxR-like ATPase